MTTVTADQLKEIVKKYYKLVDKSTAVQNSTYQFHRSPQAVEEISNIFADNAVYLRDGSAPFRGKGNIKSFFDGDRSLVGQHAVETIEDVQVTRDIVGFSSEFQHVDKSTLQCIKVKGHFTGAKFSLDTSGASQSAEGAILPFTDYWVFDGDKAIYRYSEITRDLAQERY